MRRDRAFGCFRVRSLYTRYLAGHELSTTAGAIPQTLPAPLLQPHLLDRADLFLAGFSRPPHLLRARSHNLDHYARRMDHHPLASGGLGVTEQLDKIIDVFKEHLQALRDGRAEATGLVIISKLMIARSHALLDKIEAEQSARRSPTRRS